MKHLLALAMLLGFGAVACNSSKESQTYEVADMETVTLDITGMT